MDYNADILKYSKVQDFFSNVTVTTAGSVFILNSIGTGTDFNQRIGRVINLEAIRLRFAITPTPTFDMIDQRMRVILVLDKQSNSLVSTLISEVLETISTFSNENYSNRLRFVILKDWVYQLGRLTVANGLISSSTYACEDMYMRLNIPAIYGSTSGLVAPESGALYLMCISSGASLNPAFSFTSRVYFNDP